MKALEKYAFIFAGICAVMAWLLPNHYLPWSTFHADALMAFGFCVLLVTAWCYRSAEYVSFGVLQWALLTVVLGTIAYRIFGAVNYWTQAVLPALYIFGFLQVLLFGQVLKEQDPSRLESLIFLPPLVAAVVSVGLQLSQWLSIPEYGMTDIWIFQSNGVRPAANMNQPNQLATLLLWGLISGGWLHRRRLVSLVGLTFLSAFLAFGVGLTLSRTAILGFCVASLFLIMSNFSSIKAKHLVAWIAVVVVFCIAWNTHSLVPRWLDISSVSVSGIENVNRDNGLRITIWKMFVEAVLEKPVFGYGPQMTLSAQFSNIENFPELSNDLYAHAHNIVLDLMVWYGLPIVVLVAVVFFYWFLSVLNKSIDTAGRNDFYIMMLLVVFVHANLELPLHHAYFLLPTGLIFGALITEGEMLFPSVIRRVSMKMLVIMAVFTLGICLLVFKEYMSIERQVYNYRFKSLNILNHENPVPPSAYVLDQLSDQLWFYMLDVNSKLSQEDLIRAYKFISSYESCDAHRKYLQILLLSDKSNADQYADMLQNKCGAR